MGMSALDMATGSTNATDFEADPLSPNVASSVFNAPRDEQCIDERTARAPEPATVLVVQADGNLPRRRSRRELGQDTRTPGERLMVTLGRTAPADLPPVSALGLETALEAMAPASMLALCADLDCWLDWCAHEHRQALPADPENLVRYLRALEADGKKPATLARRIASLATVHRLLGLADEQAPTAAPMVRNALRANRRRKGAAQRQAAPLRFGGALGEARVHHHEPAECVQRRFAGHPRCRLDFAWL